MKATKNCIVAASVIATLAGAASADLVDGRAQLGGWDFSSGLALDTIGDNHGEIEGRARIGSYGGRDAAGFLRGRDSDYIKFEDRAAYQLSDGAIAIDFKQTGHWNSMETLFSKDSRGYMNGGHLTISLLEADDDDNHHGRSGDHDDDDMGYVQVRFQSTNDSFYVNSGLLDLNQWYNMQFEFGAEGMKLAIDGAVVDSNNYTGGLLGNTEEFSIGSSRWASNSGDWNHMSNGYSGYISSVGIYGNAIPAPGALALIMTGGLLCTRRRR